jgi:hypothetical protein
LSGGTNDGAVVTPNYDYPTSVVSSPSGFFQMSPIIVGRGGANLSAGGLGCGGGGASTTDGGAGGAGMAVIISW